MRSVGMNSVLDFPRPEVSKQPRTVQLPPVPAAATATAPPSPRHPGLPCPRCGPERRVARRSQGASTSSPSKQEVNNLTMTSNRGWRRPAATFRLTQAHQTCRFIWGPQSCGDTAVESLRTGGPDAVRAAREWAWSPRGGAMAGMLRWPRRSAERGPAAVPGLVDLEPRNLVGDRPVSGARRARACQLRKQRLGIVPAPEHSRGPIPRRLDLFVRFTTEKTEVTLRDAVGKHRLPPSGYSHANPFPGA
jgi:hypothetical protein